MKNVVVTGSTGSIGTQTLDILRHHADELRVVALTANSSVELICDQAMEFKPDLVAMYDPASADKVAARLAGTGIKVVAQMDGLIEAAETKEADIVVTAMVGMIGIRPTIAAIKAGHDIALANKETLVCAGHIIMPLRGGTSEEVERIILTASGGPFRTKTYEELKNVKAADALKHPNWDMGNKITIDSATLVNKGLEVMEACHLFGVTLDEIEVVIHPQSVIHSAVRFRDGAVIAQLGCPDMKLPRQYALFYPNRPFLDIERVDFFKLSQMTFEKPDPDRFEGFKYALEAARRAGSMPTVFTAANEQAVALFLAGKIGFSEIPRIVEETLSRVRIFPVASREDVLEAGRQATEIAAAAERS